MRKVTVFCAAVAIVALAGSAQGATVNYAVDGWGPTSYPGPVTPPAGSPHGADGYPGDTVELLAYSDSLSVTVTNLGETETFIKKINTLRWTVDYTYAGTETEWDYPDHWGQPSFNIDATRGMTVDGAGGSLSQAGLLWVNWYNDDLSFAIGSTTSFVVGSYRVDVTPLGLPAETNVFPPGGNPWAQDDRDVKAQFDVTVIPEPLTMLGMFLGLGSVGAYIRRRRAL